MNDDTNNGFLSTIRKRLMERSGGSQPTVPTNKDDAPIERMFDDLFTMIDDNGKRIKKINGNDGIGPLPGEMNSQTPPFMANMLREHGNVEKGSMAEEKLEVAPDEKVEEKVTPLLEKEKLKALEANLNTDVFGQSGVINEICNTLKVAHLGLSINPKKPKGNYLFAGPSGVGKTELALALAKWLGVKLLKLNMGEYGLENDVTKLIGPPPGYKGFEEGGVLTNFAKKEKKGIILLDELEKAHPSLNKIFLSIMDDGECADGKGEVAHFNEFIIISTSNLGAEVEYMQGVDKQVKDNYRMDAIKAGLAPEMINRYDSVFHFAALSQEIYAKVVEKFFKKVMGAVDERHKLNLKYSPKLFEFIVEKSFDPAMGGRPARRFIEKIVVQPLADYMMEDTFEQALHEHPNIMLDLNKAGNICFKGKNNKVLGVLENTKELVAMNEQGKFTDKS